MEKLINDFLDKLLGKDIICHFRGNWGDNHFSIMTKDRETEIILFKTYGYPNKTKVKTRVPPDLCKVLTSFFGIPLHDAHIYIRHWFWNLHGITHEDDLLKFIPSDFTYY